MDHLLFQKKLSIFQNCNSSFKIVRKYNKYYSKIYLIKMNIVYAHACCSTFTNTKFANEFVVFENTSGLERLLLDKTLQINKNTQFPVISFSNLLLYLWTYLRRPRYLKFI